MGIDYLNIRELYDKIIEDRAAARGVVLFENVTLPSNRSNPDSLKFDGNTYEYSDGSAFTKVGRAVLSTNATHIFIFNGLREALQQPDDIKHILKSYDVKIFGKLDKSDLDFYNKNQRSQAMGETRIKTQSGRIWKNIKSPTLKKNVSVIAFWCREKDITPEYLQELKTCFKVVDLLWVASDSANFNYDGDTYRDSSSGQIKELRSKVYPELSHDDIVDILMRSHTGGFNLTPHEKKVAWEFRGFDPLEIKQVTGGYPSVAEYGYRKKLSENTKIK